MREKLLFVLFFVPIMVFSQDYQFAGKHYLASFYDCDERAISNPSALIKIMEKATKASGATILNQSSYTFDGGGLTMVFLLSESHASIHTYPEHKACFVDLFTCGDSCSPYTFDEILTQYLKPHKKSLDLIDRS